MSAWIGVDTYTDYFGNPNSDLQGGVSSLKDQNLSEQTVANIKSRSQPPCPPAPSPAPLQQAGYQIISAAEAH